MNNGANNTKSNLYNNQNMVGSQVNYSNQVVNTNPPVTSIPINKDVQEVKIIKKKSKVAPFLFFVILILLAYIGYSYLTNKSTIENLTYNCTPISSANEEKKLDINSTLVESLYEKVETNIREDVAQPEWNDTMRRYLAYRQITDDKKYESNCNLFDQSSMDPYTCTGTFIPLAFKQEELELQWKKLYGENTPFTHGNIKLDYDCIGGYQYIPDRKEYVQGNCGSEKATSLKATKNLVEATSNGNTIILKEEVKYSGIEGIEVPNYLKSGYYYYNFRLDMNYNYVLVSRTYQAKY